MDLLPTYGVRYNGIPNMPFCAALLGGQVSVMLAIHSPQLSRIIHFRPPTPPLTVYLRTRLFASVRAFYLHHIQQRQFFRALAFGNPSPTSVPHDPYSHRCVCYVPPTPQVDVFSSQMGFVGSEALPATAAALLLPWAPAVPYAGTNRGDYRYRVTARRGKSFRRSAGVVQHSPGRGPLLAA